MATGEGDEGTIVYREPKDEEDKDVMDSLDDVHDVGVFCQVTSVFAAASPKDSVYFFRSTNDSFVRSPTLLSVVR